MLLELGESLAECHTLLSVLEEEYEDGSSAFIVRSTTQYDAFRIFMAHSDQARARWFSERRCLGRFICVVEHSTRAQNIAKFMEGTSKHMRVLG